MKKWYATIQAHDESTGGKIKIGIVKHDEQFQIVASNGDELEIALQDTMDDAISAIHGTWHNWKTFEWVD